MLGVAGIFNGQNCSAELCKNMFEKLGGMNPAIKDNDYKIHLKNRSALIVSTFMDDLSGETGFISGDGNVLVGIDGEFFNLDELLGLDITQDLVSPAEKIYHLYKRYELGMVEKLIGTFSLVIIDNNKDSLYLISDRFGLRPLYYHNRGNSAYFASKVKAIASILDDKPADNINGLAEFLILGMPFGSSTLTKDILLVPQASIITISKGTVSSKKYWELQFPSSHRSLQSPGRYFQEFKDSFETAVDRVLGDDYVYDIPLSGGMDSRCILAAASKEKVIRTYTLGSMGSDDLKLGHEVARLFNLENQQYRISAEDFMNWIPESVYITDGMYSPIHAPIMHIASHLPQDSKVVIDGIYPFDGRYKFHKVFLPSHKLTTENIAAAFLKLCPEPLISESFLLDNDLISREYYETVLSHLRDLIEDQGKACLAQAGNIFECYDYFDQTNRIPRYNGTGAILLRSVCEVRQPLFDQQLVDRFLHYSILCRTKEKFLMARYLNDKNPAAAKILYERTGLPANAGMISLLNRYGKIIIKRYLNKLTGRRNIPHVAIDYFRFFNEDKKLQDYFRDHLLQPRFINRGFVNINKMETYLDDLFKGKKENMGLAVRLLTMELWKRNQ